MTNAMQATASLHPSQMSRVFTFTL